MYREEDKLILNVLDNKVVIPLLEVEFFERQGKKVYITFRDQNQLSFFGDISDLWDLVKDAPFTRCHGDYLVSNHAITAIYPDYIQLENRLIAISNGFRDELNRHMDEIMQCIRQRMSCEEWGMLKGVSGTYEGTLYPIRRDEDVVIGRDPEVADVIFETPEISRKHCIIRYLGRGKGYGLMDVSTNGTYVVGGPEVSDEKFTYIPEGSRISLSDGRAVFCLE